MIYPGSFYSNIKNDISFLMDNLIVVLIEHQTTINPNMPLRFLSYVDELYRRYTQPQQRKIYGSDLIKLPTPEFFVFYDGDDTSFEQKTLRLSDSFMATSSNLELLVHVYNLADGINQDLKDRCQPLKEYSIFSNQYKALRKQHLGIDEAVHQTIQYCLKHNIMTDYIKNNEMEVSDMFGFEWNEDEYRKALLETGEARGEARGKAQGRFDATLGNIRSLMQSTKWSAEEAMKALNISPAEYSHYRAFL